MMLTAKDYYRLQAEVHWDWPPAKIIENLIGFCYRQIIRHPEECAVYAEYIVDFRDMATEL